MVKAVRRAACCKSACGRAPRATYVRGSGCVLGVLRVCRVVNGVGETLEWSEGELLGLSARDGKVYGSGAISPEMVAGGGADEGGHGSRGV